MCFQIVFWRKLYLECAGHVPMCALQGPLIELHRGGELGYLLFKSYNLSLQSTVPYLPGSHELIEFRKPAFYIQYAFLHSSPPHSPTLWAFGYWWQGLTKQSL